MDDLKETGSLKEVGGTDPLFKETPPCDKNLPEQKFSSNALVGIALAGMLFILFVSSIVSSGSQEDQQLTGPDEELAGPCVAQEHELPTHIMFPHSSVKLVSELVDIEEDALLNKGDVYGLGFDTVLADDYKFYVFPSGEVIVNGTLFDHDQIPDLSSSRQEERHTILSKLDTMGIPLIRPAEYDASKPSAIIFTDPDCPVCRELMQEDLRGWNVTHVLWPLVSIHPRSLGRVQQILDTGNPLLALEDYMTRGLELPSSAGKSSPFPLKKVFSLAESLGLQGTPSIIAPDGARLPYTRNVDSMTRALIQHQ